MHSGVNRNDLVRLIGLLMSPREHHLSEEDSGAILHAFGAACPDPVCARWLVVECLDPMTDEEIVDRALAMNSQKAGRDA
jgi:hypothetical protein